MESPKNSLYFKKWKPWKASYISVKATFHTKLENIKKSPLDNLSYFRK